MDIMQAGDFRRNVEAAAQHCEVALESTLAQRKRFKIPKLPLHKELGELAYEFLQSVVPTGTRMGTQWSNVLKFESSSNDTILRNRRWAGYAEKGDDKLWEEIKGLNVAMCPHK